MWWYIEIRNLSIKRRKKKLEKRNKEQTVVDIARFTWCKPWKIRVQPVRPISEGINCRFAGTQRARFQHFSPENLFIDLCAQTLLLEMYYQPVVCNFMAISDATDLGYIYPPIYPLPLFFLLFLFSPLPLFIRDIRHLFTTGNKFSSLMHSCSRVIYPNVSCNNIVPTAGLQYY